MVWATWLCFGILVIAVGSLLRVPFRVRIHVRVDGERYDVRIQGSWMRWCWQRQWGDIWEEACAKMGVRRDDRSMRIVWWMKRLGTVWRIQSIRWNTVVGIGGRAQTAVWIGCLWMLKGWGVQAILKRWSLSLRQTPCMRIDFAENEAVVETEVEFSGRWSWRRALSWRSLRSLWGESF